MEESFGGSRMDYYVGLLQVAGMDVEKAKFNEMSPPPSGGVRKGTTAPEVEGLLHNRH